VTTDIRLAFAHPEERSLASASADPRDRISLRDHMVEVDIGAFQKERGHTQRILFNIVVEVRPAPQPLNDDVDRILSYDRLTEAIATEFVAKSAADGYTLGFVTTGQLAILPHMQKLGFDPHLVLHTSCGRPVQLINGGKPIRELFA
jgi:hypothetical protein